MIRICVETHKTKYGNFAFNIFVDPASNKGTMNDIVEVHAAGKAIRQITEALSKGATDVLMADSKDPDFNEQVMDAAKKRLGI